jgi:hypothetical protein
MYFSIWLLSFALCDASFLRSLYEFLRRFFIIRRILFGFEKQKSRLAIPKNV